MNRLLLSSKEAASLAAGVQMRGWGRRSLQTGNSLLGLECADGRTGGSGGALDPIWWAAPLPGGTQRRACKTWVPCSQAPAHLVLPWGPGRAVNETDLGPGAWASSVWAAGNTDDKPTNTRQGWGVGEGGKPGHGLFLKM